jgi:DNA end-binding protein Ku
MFYADEVRDFGAIDLEEGPVKEKEIKLAEMLIAELTEKKFNPLQYKDEYRRRLLDRIRGKSKGRDIVGQDEEEDEDEKGGEVIDIMEALRRSLDGGAKGRKQAPAKRTTARPTTRKQSSSKTTTRKRRAS